jgi:hypothetical protein
MTARQHHYVSMRTKFCQLILFCALLLATTCAYIEARAQDAPQAPKPDVGWLDHWRVSTVSFGTVERDQAGRNFYRVVGTGVLVATDPQTAYIVTAKHIFDDTTKQWHPKDLHLRFAWQERRSVYDYFGITISLFDANQNQLWLAARGQDIAAIPISLSKMELGEGIEPHAVFVEDIAKTADLFEGANVMVLGFPGIVGNEYLVRAITRAGIVAWMNPDDPYGKPFLIDANIYPGNSGGPVLKVPTGISKTGGFAVGGKPTLLGIVSQAPSVNQELTLTVPGQLLPLQLRQSIPLGGTGVIEPALEIPDLLKRLASQ